MKQIQKIQFEKDRKMMARMSKINSIKQTLMHIPIISKNKTMIQKRISEHRQIQSQSLHDSKTHSTQSIHIHPSIQHFQIFQLKYQMREKIGEGSDGVVHKCIKRKNNKQYAVKSFMFQQQRLLDIKNNFILLKNLKHKNIMSHEALYIDIQKHICWIVMELLSGQKLTKYNIQSQNQMRFIFLQIIQAIHFLHHRSISHRDIKPQNILYNKQTKQIKLIDFGICKKNRRRGVTFNMLTITGTLYYRAPQVFIGGGYNQKVDLWSAGILLYRLVQGKTPFQSQYLSQTIQNIMNNPVQFSIKFFQYSSSLKNLIKRLLKKDPQQRLSSSQCLRDLWFYSIHSCHNARKSSQNYDLLNDEPIQSPLIFQNLLHDPLLIKTINNSQFQCIDSDGEVQQKINLKKRRQSFQDQLNNFTLN